MKTHQIKRAVVSAALVIAAGVALASSTQARPGYVAQAQKLGFDAQDCTYCHTKASGGSGWNARGKWLRVQKKTRHAEAVDVAWLKDYKGK